MIIIWVCRNRFLLTKLNIANYSARIIFSKIVEIAMFVVDLWKIQVTAFIDQRSS